MPVKMMVSTIADAVAMQFGLFIQINKMRWRHLQSWK